MYQLLHPAENTDPDNLLVDLVNPNVFDRFFDVEDEGATVYDWGDEDPRDVFDLTSHE